MESDLQKHVQGMEVHELVFQHEALTRAKKLIEKPLGWTQKALARDENGFRIRYNDPEATCFCAVGALMKVHTELSGNYAESEKLLMFATGRALTVFNDTNNLAAVVKKFDEVIDTIKLEIHDRCSGKF